MSEPIMRAIRAYDYGGPEVLVFEQAPRPEPRGGQVLIRVLRAGVNPADWKFRAGFMKAFRSLEFPWIPGLDGAGIVEAVGEGVSGFRKGQAVFGRFSGSYAEYAVGDPGELQPKPENLSFEEAAAVPVGGMTAWQVVIETAQVQAGQRVLVHGAAGGVGLIAVQLARWKGAQVTGTASASNLDYVRSLGAEAIDYNAAPFETIVHDIDLVVDTVGDDLPERSLKVLKPGGALISVAARPSPEMGEERGVRILSAARATGDKLKPLTDLIAKGQVKPVAGKIFPLAEARQAHELCETGHGRGRIVLRVQD
jgi:NADPH:quinone reductase-like Zn-dependent oxidoreductase